MTWQRTTGQIAAIAFAVCGSVGSASAQVETTIDQISPPLRVILQAPHAPRTSAPPPQLSTKQQSDPVSRQLTTERRSAAPSSQLYKGRRSAESAEPLSRPRDGRTSSVERVEGKDRCDPATRDKRQQATCAQAIETRAAQFARPDTTPLSPEQRIVAEQRLRERSASSSGTARRLAASGGGADTAEGQEVASIVLARPIEPAPEKQPEEDAAAADQAAAIVNAIINQPPN